jgi:uncharacterized protein (TIGR02145 family)
LCAGFDPNAEVEHYGKMKKQICDERDGLKYVYVTIGEQTWMAQNLNYETASGSYCYDDTPSNCDTYGRLYDWATAMAIEAKYNSESYSATEPHQGICPDGWHVSTYTEWMDLEDFVEADNGCSNCSASRLKTTTGWQSNYGTDKYGLSILPGGHYYSRDGGYGALITHADYFTADELDASTIKPIEVYWNTSPNFLLTVDSWNNPGINKADRASIRCLKN